jgi:hypothetical protein
MPDRAARRLTDAAARLLQGCASVRQGKKSLSAPAMLPAPLFGLSQNGPAFGRCQLQPAGDFVEGAKAAYAEVVRVETTKFDAGRGWRFLRRIHPAV